MIVLQYPLGFPLLSLRDLCHTACMVAALLPDLDALDLQAAKVLLIEQHQRYTAALTSRTSEIERLVLRVQKLQRMLFGAKREKVLRQIDQLELQLEELQAANAIEESKAGAAAECPAPAGPFRRPLPEHLPREIHTHMPRHEAAPTAAAVFASWTRTWPRCWSMCEQASRSSATCCRS